MEHGRYSHPQRWENNNNYNSNKSALETHGTIYDPDLRTRGSSYEAYHPPRRHDSLYSDPRDLIKYNDLDRFHDFDKHERRGNKDRDYRSSHERERDRRSSHERERERERNRDERERRERRESKDRSKSRGKSERSRSRSRSPRRSERDRDRERVREDSYERRERVRESHYFDDRNRDDSTVVPSATILVRGLSHRTNEDDLYQILAEWGPLRHVRVIRERGSNIPRGFAFVDFPSVEAAGRMLDCVREKGILLDGRKLLFDYSRESDNFARQNFGQRNNTPPSDWICVMCGCLNFARRTLCFQCNESRTEDAIPADARSQLGKNRGSESGATHVLVVRGLDENADEEMLRYEFAKYAPVMDLRLVRDRFTHVSKGFAFVHFNSVEDATKALEATNGTTLEKNGQLLRVSFAKNIHGPGPSSSSSLAAAAIEAATFSQQYDAVGWTPKEYNPEHASTETNQSAPAVQPGFVWDETSGYYYDASSGFYYDGNTGLYYDGNTSIWYTYDQETQQYVPYNNNNENKSTEQINNENKPEDLNKTKKVIISAPAVTSKPEIKNENEMEIIPEAIQAAANAAIAAEKKAKEIKISKSNLLANKKKMSNVLTMWKQRNQEAKLTNNPPKEFKNNNNAVPVVVEGVSNNNNNASDQVSIGTGTVMGVVKSDQVSIGTGTGTVMGVIRNRGVIKSDTAFNATSLEASSSSYLSTPLKGEVPVQTGTVQTGTVQTGTVNKGRRRFSEAPVQANNNNNREQSQYRDRAAERRSLYGSSSSIVDDLSDSMYNTNRKGSSSEIGSMPFPPGVGARTAGEPEQIESENYEVISADRALDETNLGNRILRNMGWQEGLGLGKDGSGIKEPVQAKAGGSRAGLGSEQKKKVVDPSLETQAGDDYRTILKKKTIARFREMS